jgi:hydrogenase expression/formation protein HypC
MLLLGEQPVGTHVLVHLLSAVRVLAKEEATLIDAALNGLSAAAAGHEFEAHFADLIGREPQLPPHLKRDDN